MSSSPEGNREFELRQVSDQDSTALPESARPSDESPTVISKTPPLVDAPVNSSKNKLSDLTRKPASPEALVAGIRGRRLAHYELIEPIGVGGMAAVIRARDTQLDRFVALKILPPEMALEPENVARFHQEAKAAAKLDHENIARVFYCGEDQSLHFIAFEFVEGLNLRMMIERRGRIPVAEAVRYILQVAAGLEHATTRGVVHRDVKPSNIIITPTGRAKLVDMGLARNIERKGEHDLTQSGVTLGTFDYISPEQALEPRDADARSDIYSLGCTFYHVITGQPPVPEGTAAKKLQHHQNHQPVDPRAIDPSIPDEIVMILGKMMAKNPKDRYQRPIHLVHHLMQVAQKVGAANDLPEGVLMVEAPVLGQPRTRPVLYIGLALVALVVLTALASFVSDPAKPWGRAVTLPNQDKGHAKIDGGGPAKKPGAVPAPRPEGISTVADLQDALDDRSARTINAALSETIDLGSAGLMFRGNDDQKLIIESADDQSFAGIQFHYKGSDKPFGLELASGKEVVFRRIHFEIHYDLTPTRAVGTVGIRGVKNVRFEECIFSQPNVRLSSPGKDRIPLASVVVEPTDDEAVRPVVSFDSCYFEGDLQGGGQTAVAINGAATVSATNCAFRPHGAFFHLRERCKVDKTFVQLQNCAGFVTQGPAFRLNKNASAAVRSSFTAYLNPQGNVLQDRPQPGLVYLAPESSVQFEGEKNIYRYLHLYVERKADKKSEDVPLLIDSREKFQAYLAEHKGKDDASEYLADGASDALQQVSAAPRKHDDDLAPLMFQLKAEYQQRRVGLLHTWQGKAMPLAAAALAKLPGPMPKQLKKIVDAEDQTPGPGEKVYSNVQSAVSEAVNGDVILIRHGDSRDVVVPPLQLKPGINVTLKPDDECMPRLILDKSYKDKESAVLKMQDGRLEIQGMEFVLDPGQRDVTQTIVQMGPDGFCIFKNCVFTLRAEKDNQTLSVVSSIDLDKMMKMEATGGSRSASVRFEACFIRGKGDLVALNGCRMLDVNVENSLVALDGSLLDIEAAGKAMPMTDGVRWTMMRSSIFTTESVFALRSKFGKVLTPTNADVQGCVLTSLGQDQPVVTLERDRNPDVAGFLKWSGRQNFYANFSQLRDWKEQYPETNSDYARLALPKLTEKNMHSLWDAVPDWFKPADAAEEKMMQGFGYPADAEKRMMQSIAEPDEP